MAEWNQGYDWRTELATQVCTFVRDDRVLSLFRSMCVEFRDEKKRDEERLTAWQKRRREHCLKGVRNLAELKARRKASDRLNEHDREAVDRTRPSEDINKTWVHEYYHDILEPEDVHRLRSRKKGPMLIEFWVWVPPELSHSAQPKLTVPYLFGRFTRNLHTPFGVDIDPGPASPAEQYASLAMLHDVRFPDRPPIDDLAYIECGRFTDELRKRERQHGRETVHALPDGAAPNLRGWLFDIERDLSEHLDSRTPIDGKLEYPAQSDSAPLKLMWLTKIAECVHEDTRKPEHMERYRAMIRDWAEEMVKNTRPGTEPARDRIRREHPDWSNEQVAKELSKYDLVMEDGTIRHGENALDVLHDPITITTHAGTPLNKKYATLAAIHDDSDHCAHPIDPWDGQPFDMAALCGPWGDGSPGPESVPPDEYHNAILAMKYAMLESRVSDLTDDDRPGIEGFLTVVSEDLLRTTAQGLEKVPNATEKNAHQPGEWAEPMTWSEIGFRVFGRRKLRARKVRPLFKSHEVQQFSAKLVRVRLDTLDPYLRGKIDKPKDP